jgi:hypothetical protein
VLDLGSRGHGAFLKFFAGMLNLVRRNILGK